jgi:hypothetical protein
MESIEGMKHIETVQEFNELVMHAPEKQVVVVDFYTEW